jgi:hypothetical protein
MVCVVSNFAKFLEWKGKIEFGLVDPSVEIGVAAREVIVHRHADRKGGIGE